MTTYADVPAANALHTESQQVQAAIDTLAAGGTMLNFMVGNAPPAGDPPGMPMMPVSIVCPPGSIAPAMIADLTTWLTNRKSAILTEMAALGVTP